MLNNVVIVGRLTSDPVLIKDDEKNYCEITLAVNRNFKNADGVYETDFIPCILFGNISLTTCEYCKKGDVLGIKGRLQSNDNKLEVIAEKVTFLSSKPDIKKEEN